ncbi:LysR family transcriptional regulator [Pararobbsia silviterrae]|uniref:LysR family transcriptional regulator n=1 Tax=Pararobbsia silviterrae TaxID=1792498 RepID=A0A494XV64_9BURK|nr:LysR family transcriptional regulator [Pararobbsia silviterrae]RKP51959.1 LysR family transcriptional regulator [Pararobbsia silviterrae]
MIDRIHAMRTFIRIVDSNSFVRAAESMGMPRARVTTLMQELEALLGVQLLLRTTRRLSLTIEGAAYYERCQRILADLDEMEAELRGSTDNIRGLLRVEMPSAVATALVLPALGEFHARHPLIEVAIGFSSRQVDLVGDGVDCSIELGELPDSGLAARRLGTLEHVTCASPAYLARRGVPATLDELRDHVAVQCGVQAGRRAGFDFEVGEETVEVKLDGFVQVSEDHAYLTCGLQGLGLIQPTRLAAEPYLRSGQLREVLTAWSPASTPVSVTYVKSRQVSPRVRVFVDWLVEVFERHAQDASARTVFGNTIASLTASAKATVARRAQNDPELEMHA